MQLDTNISQRSSVEDETMLFIHVGSRMGNNWKRRAYIKNFVLEYEFKCPASDDKVKGSLSNMLCF
jgi:hypothetical protein